MPSVRELLNSRRKKRLLWICSNSWRSRDLDKDHARSRAERVYHLILVFAISVIWKVYSCVFRLPALRYTYVNIVHSRRIALERCYPVTKKKKDEVQDGWTIIMVLIRRKWKEGAEQSKTDGWIRDDASIMIEKLPNWVTSVFVRIGVVGNLMEVNPMLGRQNRAHRALPSPPILTDIPDLGIQH